MYFQNGGIRNSEVGERQISHNIHTKQVVDETELSSTTTSTTTTKPVSALEASKISKSSEDCVRDSKECDQNSYPKVPANPSNDGDKLKENDQISDDKSGWESGKKSDKDPDAVSSKEKSGDIGKPDKYLVDKPPLNDSGKNPCVSASDCDSDRQCLNHECVKKASIKAVDYEDWDASSIGRQAGFKF